MSYHPIDCVTPMLIWVVQKKDNLLNVNGYVFIFIRKNGDGTAMLVKDLFRIIARKGVPTWTPFLAIVYCLCSVLHRKGDHNLINRTGSNTRKQFQDKLQVKHLLLSKYHSYLFMLNQCSIAKATKR